MTLPTDMRLAFASRSSSVLRMEEDEIRGATYTDVMALARESPRLWGAAISHRNRSLHVLRLRVFKLLDDPTMNRRRLRSAIDAIVEDIEKNGC